MHLNFCHFTWIAENYFLKKHFPFLLTAKWDPPSYLGLSGGLLQSLPWTISHKSVCAFNDSGIKNSITNSPEVENPMEISLCAMLPL